MLICEQGAAAYVDFSFHKTAAEVGVNGWATSHAWLMIAWLIADAVIDQAGMWWFRSATRCLASA